MDLPIGILRTIGDAVRQAIHDFEDQRNYRHYIGQPTCNRLQERTHVSWPIIAVMGLRGVGPKTGQSGLAWTVSMGTVARYIAHLDLELERVQKLR
jgi:hypothetical protein